MQSKISWTGSMVILAMAGLQTGSRGEALPSIPIPHSIARVVDAHWDPSSSLRITFSFRTSIGIPKRRPISRPFCCCSLTAHWGVRNVLVEGAYAGQIDSD